MNTRIFTFALALLAVCHISVAAQPHHPQGRARVGYYTPWKSLGQATYREDFIASMSNAESIVYQVEIQEHEEIPGYYRLVNPYSEAYPYNKPGDWDDSQNWYLEIHAEDPDGVYITEQQMGLDWGHGNLIVSSVAGWHIENDSSTVEEMKKAGYTGTLRNGIISFPAQTLYVCMPNYSEYFFDANNNGLFIVELPGAHLDEDKDGICDLDSQIIPVKPECKDSVYQISNPAELFWFAALVNGTLYPKEQNAAAQAVLVADILLNDTTNWQDWDEETTDLIVWTPIGSTDEGFKGTFDGQGHCVSGIYIANSDDEQGLFCYVNEQGEIKNLGVTASYIQGKDWIGGIAGYSSGIITHCHHTGNIRGNKYVGGIAGYGYEIYDCYNIGTVIGNRSTGGIVGDGSSTHNCYNSGSIKGELAVGGITGALRRGSTLSNCYNIGVVCGDSIVGSIAGHLENSTILNSFYNIENAHKETANGVTGKTTAEFASGEVCWLLNQQTDTDIAWYQTLGADMTPVLSHTHEIVHAKGGCPGKPDSYNNNDVSTPKPHPDKDHDGYCDLCKQPMAPRTKKGIYQISNKGELYWFAALVNGTLTDGTKQDTTAQAVLVADILLNDTTNWQDWDENTTSLDSWTPIGDCSSNSSNRFSGTFDGQGHTISGIYINTTDDFQGLFGYNSGTIQNVGVTASYIYGFVAGGIAGSSTGIITNCYNKGHISGWYAGGVAGYGKYLHNCYNTGTITGIGEGSGLAGGVAGYGDMLHNCYNTGAICGWQAGGIAASGTVLNNCYNTGAITGSRAGGIAASTGSRSRSLIINCHNTGTITGSELSGGIVGELDYTSVTNCYNTGQVNGLSASGIAGKIYTWASISNCYNTGIISGDSITNSIARCAWGIITNCYYNNETYSGAENSRGITGKTAAEFASGEVCWLLNRQTDTNITWHQTLGNDATPVLNAAHGVIRAEGDCPGCPTAFKNKGASKAKQHLDNDQDHYCDICGQLLLSKPAYQDSIYYISNHAELTWFAALVNGTLTDGTAQNTAANAVLTADIFLNDTTNWQTWNTNTQNLHSWTPIGWSWTNEGFSGTFDGQGHTISGIYIATELGYQGLFGYLNQGTIQNVGITASYIQGHNYVGAIVGQNFGSIQNCYNSGTISGNDCVGGIIGNNYELYEWVSRTSLKEVIHCYNTGTVSGNDRVGGIVGNNAGYITLCYNIGTIMSNKRKGGIAGYNDIVYIYEDNFSEPSRGRVDYICYYLTTDTTSDQTDNSIAYDTIHEEGEDEYEESLTNLEQSRAYDYSVGKTAAEFASGEVCWLLNGHRDTDVVWYQTLGVDMAPVLDKTHKTIYGDGGCPIKPARFKNDGPTTTGPHIPHINEDNEDDAWCERCHHYIDIE